MKTSSYFWIWDVSNFIINGNISLYFFTENMNIEFYNNILKERLLEMKRVAHKNLILVRDNLPANESEATQKIIKEKKINELEVDQLLVQIWIPLKMYGDD